MKITPTSLTVSQLLGQTNERYAIPHYQRRYSWLDRQIWELVDDIDLIEGSDTHLMGSIVCLAGTHVAGINELEVVDGQQRLTTISILLLCLKERFSAEDHDDASTVSDIDKLLTTKSITGKFSPKIKLDSIDADDFEALKSGHQDVTNLCLKNAFSIIREWVADSDIDDLKIFSYRLVNQALIIRMDVSDAKDAFKLFETINNRGLKLSQTDIIKNFLLGNAARFDTAQLMLGKANWAKLVVHLDGTNSDAFFRYYLTAVSAKRITNAKVVSQFKSMFHSQVEEAKTLPEQHLYVDVDDSYDDDGDQNDDEQLNKVNVLTQEKSSKPAVTFKNFLETLVAYAKVYDELVRASTADTIINRHLSNLKKIRAAQTYSLLMNLRMNGCTDKNLRSVLKLTESFILRRHICKERTNETEALFASMCSIDPADPVESVKSLYKELCPTDEKFMEEFSTATFTANLIDRARYCLEQFEMDKIGKYAELVVLGSDEVHVEHIIPQNINTKASVNQYGDWVKYLGPTAKAKHQKYVARIGNMTLFAGALNIAASNDPFLMKKPAYLKSGIKLTKELGAMRSFKFAQVDQRSTEMAEIAVRLWPKS